MREWFHSNLFPMSKLYYEISRPSMQRVDFQTYELEHIIVSFLNKKYNLFSCRMSSTFRNSVDVWDLRSCAPYFEKMNEFTLLELTLVLLGKGADFISI